MNALLLALSLLSPPDPACVTTEHEFDVIEVVEGQRCNVRLWRVKEGGQLAYDSRNVEPLCVYALPDGRWCIAWAIETSQWDVDANAWAPTKHVRYITARELTVTVADEDHERLYGARVPDQCLLGDAFP